MKKHGHAHGGAAMQGYRRRRKVLDLTTPAELAGWVNGHLQLADRNRVTGDHPGFNACGAGCSTGYGFNRSRPGARRATCHACSTQVPLQL